jgi:hypothetical protein
MAPAASGISRNVVSVTVVLAGDQHGDTNGLGHEIVQQPQPFGHDLIKEKIDPGRIASRPSEAGDKTQFDRIVGDAENNGDRRGRSFGC